VRCDFNIMFVKKSKLILFVCVRIFVGHTGESSLLFSVIIVFCK